MTLPVGVETVTITINAPLYPNGDLRRGQVKFTPDAKALTFDGEDLIAGPRVVLFDGVSAAAKTIELVATDAANVTPTGFTYSVAERWSDSPARTYSIALPASAPAVNLAALAPASASPGQVPDATSFGTSLVSAANATGARAVLGVSSARDLRIVATETHIPTRNGAPNNLSDGVSTGITSQLVHTVSTACAGVRLVYANYYNNGGVVSDGTNDITVKASIRNADGTYQPAFFNGRRSVVVEPGSAVISDPVPVSYIKGDTFVSRTFVSVTSGQKYPLGVTTDNVLGEGVVAGDSVDAGVINVSITKCYAPWAVLGVPRYPLGENFPRVLALGDSRVAGYGDTSGGKDAFGWVRRALDGKVSHLNLGVSGSTASGSNTPNLLRRRLALADRVGTFDVALVAYGINDLTGGSSSAMVQARLQAIFDLLAARGLRVYGATIAPVTTSTDAWATVGNQTPVASNANRIAVNNWIRTTPAPLSGFFEFADAVESARDSGLWKAPAYTVDGTHEAAAGYAAQAALIDVSDLGTELTQ